jgi:hypothetical protein
VRLTCFTRESAWSRYKHRVGKAASTILIVVAVIVVIVAVEAETTRVGSACCRHGATVITKQLAAISIQMGKCGLVETYIQ